MSNYLFNIHSEDPIWNSELTKNYLRHSDEFDLIVQKTPGEKITSRTLNLMLVPKTLMRKMIDAGAEQERRENLGFG
jgi:hypothetical protein